MKYIVEVIIDKPRDEVVSLFDNVDNMYKWMEGLQHFEHLSGEQGEVGAKSKLRFKMGNREMDMIETVTDKQLPKEFSGTYEAPGAVNYVRNIFEEIEGNRTRYIVHQEFKFESLGMRVMSFLLPGMFRKQSLKHMKAFKAFAEKS